MKRFLLSSVLLSLTPLLYIAGPLPNLPLSRISTVGLSAHAATDTIRSAVLRSISAHTLSAHAAPETFRATAIRPRITDAVTGRGIANATIVICEADARYTSDARGDLPVLSVPYLEDSRLASASYGRLTLIVYADGYRPTVLVDCVTHAHRTRLGPEISLFAKEGNDTPITIVETPPDAWVEGMVRAFPRTKKSS